MVSDSTDENNENASGWRGRMKQFYDETMESFDHKACDGVRADLRACLESSECHQVHKKSLKECIKCTDGSVPDDCKALRTTFFECKRSLLDNRQRFRGRKGY